ncbi:hypothetical protein N9937_01570 [bacterium]|nr:hypothetical protein [bacterium]
MNCSAREVEVTQRMFRDVKELLKERQKVSRQQAMNAQRHMAKNYGEASFLEDGVVDFRVNDEAYHYWGQRLGYECWNDEAFVREFKRDNPIVVVKSRSRKIMTGYRGIQSAAGPSWLGAKGTRFHKSYGVA